nr:Gfo/Idh/MocA family oxidoreductase [Roseomonas sp. GC11]
MVGGGQGAFIGAVHRMAARLDGRFDLVAGALSSTPARAQASGRELGLTADRCYSDFAAMARMEASREDGIDLVAIVTPNHTHHAIAKAFLESGIAVLCEKPMVASLEEAQDLAALVAQRSLPFCTAYTYTGYQMVRQARAMVAAGELGEIRSVHVEYAQDWLARPVEHEGNAQAAWRTDPVRSGGAGALGDIGTHAFNLAEYVSGLRCERLAASLASMVPGRLVDDDAEVLLRFTGGARGMLWASQIATGHGNALRLRVIGSKAALDWAQENPEQLRFTPLGEASRLMVRAGPGTAPHHGGRTPAGHPEGYLEAFAQLYRDMAEWLDTGSRPHNLTGIKAGLRGMAFIDAALRSSRAGSEWVEPR